MTQQRKIFLFLFYYRTFLVAILNPNTRVFSLFCPFKKGNLTTDLCSSKLDDFFNRHNIILHLVVIMLFFVDTNKKIIKKYRMRTGQFGAEPQLYSLSNNEMHLFSLSHVCCMLHDNHCRLSLSGSSFSIYSIISPSI